MARIDPQDIVEEIKDSNSYGAYRVLEYLGKEGKNHMYEIVFLRSGFKKKVNRTQATKGSVVDDLAKQKKAEAKKTTARKKIKQLETKNELIYLDKNFDDSVILSIDQSTSATGYAVYNGKVLKDYGIYTPTKTDPTPLRINLTKKRINQLIEEHKPDVIFIESVYLGINVQVLHVLSCLYGVVMDTCLENNIPCVPISAPEWKGKSGILYGDRKHQKQMGVDLVRQTFGITVGDDISDAIILGAIGIRYRINFLDRRSEY